MTLIKSISGIRGTIGGPAGENLTPPDVVKFTTAYVRLIARRNPGKKLTIVVGRDARISGEMVSNLVEGTLLACGADVVNVGLCTTPGTEMAVIGKKADGGIIITKHGHAQGPIDGLGQETDEEKDEEILHGRP